jgi:hypothetical protein
MDKKAYIITFVSGVVISGLAMADCASTMPEQLLKDCIVNEDAGHSFPPSGYVNMDMYQDWVKSQQTEQAKSLAKAEIK